MDDEDLNPLDVSDANTVSDPLDVQDMPAQSAPVAAPVMAPVGAPPAAPVAAPVAAPLPADQGGMLAAYSKALDNARAATEANRGLISQYITQQPELLDRLKQLAGDYQAQAAPTMTEKLGQAFNAWNAARTGSDAARYATKGGIATHQLVDVRPQLEGINAQRDALNNLIAQRQKLAAANMQANMTGLTMQQQQAAQALQLRTGQNDREAQLGITTASQLPNVLEKLNTIASSAGSQLTPMIGNQDTRSQVQQWIVQNRPSALMTGGPALQSALADGTAWARQKGLPFEAPKPTETTDTSGAHYVYDQSNPSKAPVQIGGSGAPAAAPITTGSGDGGTTPPANRFAGTPVDTRQPLQKDLDTTNIKSWSDQRDAMTKTAPELQDQTKQLELAEKVLKGLRDSGHTTGPITDSDVGRDVMSGLKQFGIDTNNVDTHAVIDKLSKTFKVSGVASLAAEGGRPNQFVDKSIGGTVLDPSKPLGANLAVIANMKALNRDALGRIGGLTDYESNNTRGGRVPSMGEFNNDWFNSKSEWADPAKRQQMQTQILAPIQNPYWMMSNPQLHTVDTSTLSPQQKQQFLAAAQDRGQ